MRTITIMILAGFAVIACAKQDVHAGHDHADAQTSREAKMMETQAERLIYYVCPMDEHSHIDASEPGPCSECGMDMVQGVTTTVEKMDYYGCPMLTHSHVRQDSAGTCADCGMKLKPMRLIKS